MTTKDKTEEKEAVYVVFASFHDTEIIDRIFSNAEDAEAFRALSLGEHVRIGYFLVNQTVPSLIYIWAITIPREGEILTIKPSTVFDDIEYKNYYVEDWDAWTITITAALEDQARNVAYNFRDARVASDEWTIIKHNECKY